MLFQRSTDHKPRWRRTSLVGAACLGALVLSYLIVLMAASDPFSRATYVIAKPFWQLRDRIHDGARSFIAERMSVHELALENESLRTELSILRREASRAQALSLENDDLRVLIGRLPADRRAIVAGVIHGSQYSPYDMSVLDVGEVTGVREQMVVVSPDGSAVGYISKVYTDFSTVTFFTSPSVRVDAVHVHASGTEPVVLYGQGNGTFSCVVSRESPIATGDTILLPGFSRRPLGTVAHVEGSREESAITVYVRSFVQNTALDRVWIDTTSMWLPAVHFQDGTESGTQSGHATSTGYVR